MKSSNTTHVSTTNFTRSNICRKKKKKKRKSTLQKRKRKVFFFLYFTEKCYIANFSYNKFYTRLVFNNT